ncbi:hypothetical protein ABIE00_000268 [Arthrobacter sp. OAP107]
MANNFEPGKLEGFTSTTGGTGSAAVSSDLASSGTCAAYLHTTTDARSFANLSAPLPAGAVTALYRWLIQHHTYAGRPGGGFAAARPIGIGWGSYHLTVGRWRKTDKYPGDPRLRRRRNPLVLRQQQRTIHVAPD